MGKRLSFLSVNVTTGVQDNAFFEPRGMSSGLKIQLEMRLDQFHVLSWRMNDGKKKKYSVSGYEGVKYT